MRSESVLPFSVTTEAFSPESSDDYISEIRSRLNIIGTSVYLIEDSIDNYHPANRYVQKINTELESIRKLLNR